MRLEYLKYLKTIAKSNSISTAANSLFLTQQALSKAIKSFEEELNCQLLIRTNQGVKLTKDGEYVLTIAEHVLPMIHDMEHHFALPETEKIQGSLKVMAIPYARDTFLRKTISNFYKYYPNIDFQILKGDEKEIIPALINNTIDLGFCNIVTINNQCLTHIPDEVQFVPYSKYRYTALFQATSPLAKLNEVSLSQLLQYPIILMPPAELQDFNPYKILSYFGEVNVRFVDSYDLYSQFIADGLGVTLALDTMPNTANLTPTFENTISRPISDNVFGSAGYLFHKNSLDKNPCIKLFLNEFINQ